MPQENVGNDMDSDENTGDASDEDDDVGKHGAGIPDKKSTEAAMETDSDSDDND